VQISNDGGTNWSINIGPAGLNTRFRGLAVDPTGTKIIGCTSSNVYVSLNSGVSWTVQGNGLPITGKNYQGVAASADFQTLVVANWAPGFLYVSKNGGGTWNAAY
jgi:hypothetical protein